MSRSLQARLLSLLGAEGVSQRAADLRLHASDAVRPNRLGKGAEHRAAAPGWVVWPQTVDQVQGLLQLANQERVPLVPYGGGSGLMGGALPVEAGIMVDFGRMNRIRAVSREDRSVTAEAGTVLKDLDQTLEPHGLMLGHDPWTYGVATVAGTISTNSLGYRGGYYGSMGQQVMGVEVVLPDGSLVTTKALPKFSTGLALAQLFIGTEGCYGIITAATLKTFPLPERRSLHYLRFPDFAAGFKAIQGMYDLGLTPMLMEYGEDFPMPAPAASPAADVSGETDLYLGFEGFSELVDAQVQRARALCASHGGVEGDRGEAERFWNERHRSAERFVQQRAETGLAPYLQAQQGGPAMDYLHVTVPAGRVLAYRERSLALAKARGLYLRDCGLWTRPELFSLVLVAPDGDVVRLHGAVNELLELAQDLGGAMEYCHGVGVRLAHLMEREHGVGLAVMQRLKRALDPNGIMNPGKLGL